MVTTRNTGVEGGDGQAIHPLVGNTAKDGSGTYYLIRVNEAGDLVFSTQAGEVKQAKIQATASGDTTVVAAVSGKVIRLLSVVLTCSVQVNVAWKSGASTTKIPAMPFAQYGGMSHTPSLGWFYETDSGEAAVINLSGTANVYGTVQYVEV